MTRNTAWTEDKTATLRRMAEKGASGSQIAAKIGTTRGAVGAKAARLGITLLGDHGQAPRRRVTAPTRSVSAGHACLDGANLTDPNRADKLLRRFSWEDAA